MCVYLSSDALLGQGSTGVEPHNIWLCKCIDPDCKGSNTDVSENSLMVFLFVFYISSQGQDVYVCLCVHVNLVFTNVYSYIYVNMHVCMKPETDI